MTDQEFMKLIKDEKAIKGGTEEHKMLVKYSNNAMKITAELNSSYHEPKEVNALFSKLIGKKVDETFFMFPPFYTDFGRNITVGKNVFINTGCSFQDRGGIIIGDGTQIGMNVTIATLNHGFKLENRNTTYPMPVKIGKNVWIGSNATIVPGAVIGDNSVVAAGAVVIGVIPQDVVVAGCPARIIKSIEQCDR
ncbi:MAG: sugar O-acetyltransferase [Clostridium butyricum]|nr:sugar O-acetyltransferase [Clostridium butyricum]